MSDSAASSTFELRRHWPHLAVAAAVAAVILAPGAAILAISGFAAGFLSVFDWLVLWACSAFVVICVGVAVSPAGRLRLGGPDAKPDYGRLGWFSMLFAAGMGAGLVFWGAAEPLIFTTSPPPGGAAPGTEAAAREAMALTMLHWAIHPWAIYALSALVIAFFAFREGAPLSPSAPFYRAGRGLGRLIDWAALIAVLFGVVASLGQGLIQMSAGAALLTGSADPNSKTVQLVLLGVLAAVYLASALGGIGRGIKPLSSFNMILCAVLMVFVLAAGPAGAIFGTIGTALYDYLWNFIPLSVDLREAGEGRQWTRDWTLTYFLWWVAWGPFVGVFIARISRGRTIREFILGVVVAPSVFTLLWFGAIGGAGLDLTLKGGFDLGVTDFATAPLGTYAVLEYLPLSTLMQAAAFLLIFTFLVTSADSGAYVLAMFSQGGAARPPAWERAFWGLVLAGLTAGAVLSGEGQNATRAMAVAGAVPLFFLLIAQTVQFLRALLKNPNASAPV